MEPKNPHDIQFEIVWNKVTPELTAQMVTLWKESGITTGKEAPEERAKQAVMVAKNREGKVIAITTAFPSHVSQMKNHLFIFRSLIHKEFRIPGLLGILTSKTIGFLESIYEQTEPYCIGVMAIIQNPKLKQLNTVHTHSGLTFIGFAPDGSPMRAYFFKNARFK